MSTHYVGTLKVEKKKEMEMNGGVGSSSRNEDILGAHSWVWYYGRNPCQRLFKLSCKFNPENENQHHIPLLCFLSLLAASVHS